jgi:hypothetical protein
MNIVPHNVKKLGARDSIALIVQKTANPHQSKLME